MVLVLYQTLCLGRLMVLVLGCYCWDFYFCVGFEKFVGNVDDICGCDDICSWG